MTPLSLSFLVEKSIAFASSQILFTVLEKNCDEKYITPEAALENENTVIGYLFLMLNSKYGKEIDQNIQKLLRETIRDYHFESDSGQSSFPDHSVPLENTN